MSLFIPASLHFGPHRGGRGLQVNSTTESRYREYRERPRSHTLGDAGRKTRHRTAPQDGKTGQRLRTGQFSNIGRRKGQRHRTRTVQNPRDAGRAGQNSAAAGLQYSTEHGTQDKTEQRYRTAKQTGSTGCRTGHRHRTGKRNRTATQDTTQERTVTRDTGQHGTGQHAAQDGRRPSGPDVRDSKSSITLCSLGGRTGDGPG